VNAGELADYLINHDWESDIICRRYEYIQEAMRDGEMPKADFDTILEAALEIANTILAAVGLLQLYVDLTDRKELGLDERIMPLRLELPIIHGGP
jgi:hypothetical protein